jgi:hypothetical protein
MANGLNWTQEDVDAYEARRAMQERKSKPVQTSASSSDPAIDIPDPGPERDLQTKCENLCDQMGLPWFHDRSKKCNKEGLPDLLVACPGGVTLWCELKSKDGRMSEAQKQWLLQLMALGHKWYQVKSFKRFAQLIAEWGRRKET